MVKEDLDEVNKKIKEQFDKFSENFDNLLGIRKISKEIKPSDIQQEDEEAEIKSRDLTKVEISKNFEEGWNKVGNKREASYTNLDPGKYLLRVKGSNNDGVWNKQGASIEIIITPPFWQTLWFRILMFIFLIMVIYTIYKIEWPIENHCGRY